MKEKGLEIKQMHIKYVFTDGELADIACGLASKTSEKQSLEDKKKEVTSQIAGEINGTAAAISRLSKIYNQGYEYRNAECYEVFDYDTKTVFVHRADTERQVSVRTMTASEFQREIFDPREKLVGGLDTAMKEDITIRGKKKSKEFVNDKPV